MSKSRGERLGADFASHDPTKSYKIIFFQILDGICIHFEWILADIGPIFDGFWWITAVFLTICGATNRQNDNTTTQRTTERRND